MTAVELLPVQPTVDEQHLVSKNLRNYWGYNQINYFAPDPRFLHHGQIREFKMMVANLHAAGIEVILDVVYNHTGEGNEFGPTVSFRGIDNASYYVLAADRRRYADYTGCGNSINVRHPRVLQMIMDSLRYWVEEMHVDGFRFDLTSTLGREPHGYDPHAGFFDAVLQDPVLSRVKMIAEPWDVGIGGYQLGNYPPAGRNGTTASATPPAASGAATAASSASSPGESAARRTSSAARPAPLGQHQFHHRS